MRGEGKVAAQHLVRTALIYVRQSTMAQVREHTESTARQYALAEEAARLGWPATAIEVIDADLGVSGRSAEGRDGFKGLVARVCLGEVGAIFGSGGLAAGPLLGGPVAAAGVRPADRHAGHRRRRGLRPDRLQRPAAARAEGHDERGGAAPARRPAAGSQTRGGRTRRAAHPAAGRLRLRRRGPGGDRPGRGGDQPRSPTCSPRSPPPARPTRWWPPSPTGGSPAAPTAGRGRAELQFGPADPLPGARHPGRTRSMPGPKCSADSALVGWSTRTGRCARSPPSSRAPSGACASTTTTRHTSAGSSSWPTRRSSPRTAPTPAPAHHGRAPSLCQGIVFCGSCGRAMSTRYAGGQPYYECARARADHVATPDCRSVRSSTVDEAVAAACSPRSPPRSWRWRWPPPTR